MHAIIKYHNTLLQSLYQWNKPCLLLIGLCTVQCHVVYMALQYTCIWYTHVQLCNSFSTILVCQLIAGVYNMYGNANITSSSNEQIVFAELHHFTNQIFHYKVPNAMLCMHACMTCPALVSYKLFYLAIHASDRVLAVQRDQSQCSTQSIVMSSKMWLLFFFCLVHCLLVQHVCQASSDCQERKSYSLIASLL